MDSTRRQLVDRGTHACACGAQGDVGELTEHLVTAIGNPDDRREHRVVHGAPIPEADQPRAAREHREQTRARIAEAAGVTVAELRQALR